MQCSVIFWSLFYADAEVLRHVQDLVLDFPDAAHQLTLFLARAVADGVLPSTFLQSVLPSLSDASLGVSVVQSAGMRLAARCTPTCDAMFATGDEAHHL